MTPINSFPRRFMDPNPVRIISPRKQTGGGPVIYPAARKTNWKHWAGLICLVLFGVGVVGLIWWGMFHG